MKLFRPVIIAVVLFLGTVCRAQERDDFGIWQSINLKGNIGKGWSAGLWFEHRSKESARTLDCALVMPYVNYRPVSYLQFGYSSEYILTGGPKYITCRPSVTLLLSSGDLSFQLRELPIYEHNLDTGNGSWTLRTRGKAAYAIPGTHLKPYVSCELFTADKWKKTRHYFGTEWKIDKHSTLDVFYMYYVMSTLPYQRHVLGLSYTFGL